MANAQPLTRAALLRMPKSAYMNAEQRDFFRRLLLEQRGETQEAIEQIKQEIAGMEREADELDRALIEEENRQRMRIAERHFFLLNKIKTALDRIEDGSYGYCRDSGEPIGLERLLLRPTAELCIEEKTRQEALERNFAKQRI